MEFQNVWVPDDKEGYILGKYLPMDTGNIEELTILINNPNHPSMHEHIDNVYPAEEYDRDVEDNCALMYLNPATLLNNIQLRYKKNKIYTYVANILIAVNPYFEIKDLYSTKTIKSYQGKSIGVMPPHVFAIADKSFRDMRSSKQSQSIIVSGESGAGKTESTKYLIRYLCELWGSTAGPVEQKIMDANPVMEAFGNAKTTRNNNSSRFGKFMEVHFDNKCQVVGGFISHYLLEKSRICTQAPDERNYHVFYLLCAGAPDSLRSKLSITKPDDFHYLKSERSLNLNHNLPSRSFSSIKERSNKNDGAIGDTIQEFNNMDEALSRLGLSENDKMNVYTMVASVLHLGNVSFEENSISTKGGCQISKRSEKSLNLAANLMCIDHKDLRTALLSRLIQSNRGGSKGTVIMVPLKVSDANNARDALAKAVYSKLFDYIVQRINKSIPFKASSYYIGVLDIAGFEYFTVNSFEQFCINYCNEKLQQFFNERILRDEQDLYKKEHLKVPKIEYRDNQDCIVLIESKGVGIFSLLDEESKLPKHSADHFTMEVHRQWTGHFRLALPRTSRLKVHREIRDDEGFMIRHFAGAVCYQTSQFIEKNNDALHASLEGLILESKNPFLQGLFTTTNSNQQKGKLTFISVGSKFKAQLEELMDKLKGTGTNFIRCIKPNQKMVDHQFEGGSILSQLESSGMTSVLELMQSGFPSRVSFIELHTMYKQYLRGNLSKLNPQMFCKALKDAMGITNQDYRFGVSKMFFRANKFAEFDVIMKEDAEHLASMIDNIQLWFRCMRWKKVQLCVLAVIKFKKQINARSKQIILIQKMVRMYLSRKQNRPRYATIYLLKINLNVLKEMEKCLPQIFNAKQKTDNAHQDYWPQFHSISADIQLAITRIKDEVKIERDEIQILYNSIVQKMNHLQSELYTAMLDQKNSVEQERLANIQKEMEKQRELEEEQERMKQSKAEELRMLNLERDIRRKALLELTQEYVNGDELTLQEEITLSNNHAYEQTKRDYELATRLAQENNETLEPFTTPSAPPLQSNQMFHRSQLKHKHDLSKWKFTELRDTINTSCDIELLEACRIEFHRRLKVYHAWKAKNRKRTTVNENERAPPSVMNASTKAAPRSQGNANVKAIIQVSSQRYFRIPFIRPNTGSNNNSPLMEVESPASRKGWWYAHFDGEYVARQMELHPDKPSMLLVAGVDDMQMCELSLDETGLTRKRGAEILDHEFNKEWERNGGKNYTLPADRKK